MSQTGSHWRIDRPLDKVEQVPLPQVQHPFTIRTYLPEGYEPRYPYPLLVLFHPNGSNEDQAIRLVPKISRRNFVVISMRGPELLGVRENGELACGWGQDESTKNLVTDHLVHAVEQTRQHIHVNPERIYLVGLCEGATPAYRSGFALAGRVAGVAAINGAIPKREPGLPLFRMDQVRNLKFWLAHGIANSVVPCSRSLQDHRLLETAGACAKLSTYATTHRIHEDMLRDLNRWIMDLINQDTDQLVAVQ